MIPVSVFVLRTFCVREPLGGNVSYQEPGPQWGPPQPPGPSGAPPGQQQWGAPQPPPAKKGRLVPVLIGVGAFLVTIVVIAAVVGGADKKADAKVDNSPGTQVQSQDQPDPTATPTSQHWVGKTP